MGNPDKPVSVERQPKGIQARVAREVTLATAARMLHVDPRTLRTWLESERGLIFPRIRGSSALVVMGDVMAVVEKRLAVRKETPSISWLDP